MGKRGGGDLGGGSGDGMGGGGGGGGGGEGGRGEGVVAGIVYGMCLDSVLVLGSPPLNWRRVVADAWGGCAGEETGF